MMHGIPRTLTGALGVTVLALTASLGLACGRSEASEAAATPAAAPRPVAAASAPAPQPSAVPVAAPKAAPAGGETAFTGDRDEIARFIRYYREISLTPEQERVKVEALSAIPAPCCSDNSLATCCCPCNMAKAAWGLSAWLITEKGQGVEQVRQAARDWLAAAAPDGFTGDSCYQGGCMRPIHQNGCGGMDESQVL